MVHLNEIKEGSFSWMKKLFLVSSFEEVSSKLYLFDKELIRKTVTFIPTASKVEEVTFYVEAGKKALEELGLIVDKLDISTASTKEIEQKIRGNDYIYVTGGCTFYLLQELKKSGTDQMIIEEIEKGKGYIGESAGAIVLSETVDYVKEMDDPEKAPDLASFSGLNVVDFYTVPHYKCAPFGELTEKIEAELAEKINLCLITNQQGIIVEDNKRQIVTVD